MLEIQEKFDTTGYEAVVKRAGTHILHITEAMEQGRAVGFIAYSYQAESVVVYDYDDNGDLMLCDGLVRSVMFKSVLKGIETMIFDIENADRYENLRKLRFISENGNICENLDGFMNACESCGNKKEAD
ncbi:MAG: hypothetical protein NC340_04360 [Ruminococcus flavefaciens]|nr:hypothetical protein [Ruminococcus flavefaciens]MCM1229103.1 hypothetical protein [Ruminococcus flavefaciens]